MNMPTSQLIVIPFADREEKKSTLRLFKKIINKSIQDVHGGNTFRLSSTQSDCTATNVLCAADDKEPKVHCTCNKSQHISVQSPVTVEVYVWVGRYEPLFGLWPSIEQVPHLRG